MTGRERIRHVLRGGRADRLPRALFGGGLWSYRRCGLRPDGLKDDPAAFGNRLADLWGGLDTDIVFLGSGLNTLPAEAIGGELAFGDGQAPLLSFPLVQSAEDARELVDIDLDAAPAALALVEMIAQVRRRLPARHLCVTSWGPFTWGMILCDWHLLQERSISDPGFVAAVCDLGVRLSAALFERLAARGLVDGACIADGAVTLVAGDLYRDVVLPRERALFERARAAGLDCFLHQCGKIATQIPLYPETGADCITLDAGVPIGEVHDLYGRRTTTAGNVDVIQCVRGGDEAAIREAVRACVAGVRTPLERYILMPSCDLPADTRIENVRAFLAAADQFGLSSAS
ncbi:MAG TPA: uroporphyrinogen decarboxylase family protein [bacterium]